MMLAVSLSSVRALQTDFCLNVFASFSKDRAHHGKLILNYFTQQISDNGHEHHSHTLQTSPIPTNAVT